jgi:hypothetical protein
MAENIVAGLFGLTPEMYGERQRTSALQEGITLAQLDPASRGAALTYGGARGLGTAIGGAMGIEDPQLKMISARNTIAQQIDQSNPESILKGAQMLAQMGDQQGAMALAQYARQAQSEMALVQQRRASEQSSLATAAKTQLSVKQEEDLRSELSKLGPDATQDQVIGVLTKYGPPEKVLAALTAAQSRTEATQARTAGLEAANLAKTEAAKTAADAALERAKVAADAKIEAARERGATAMQIAQMQNQTKQDLAVLAASLKGPSAAVLKAQEKAEKAAEGKEVLSDTLETAKTLVNDLYKLGGMTSTSKQPLANLVTSLQSGTAGQIAGQALGTKTQAKRDELKSIRLQLLNAIKEATGMSAQQLNSNVELKTYLDSLGSEKMTKEANLAIIENISTRYLKGQAAKPEKDKADPLGIR